MNKEKAFIYGINGPICKVKNAPFLKMMEMVYVGEMGLLGEVIAIQGEDTLIQVYEETSGLKVGEPVVATHSLLSVTLGPGLMGNIFDGIERPLVVMETMSGAFISRGLKPDAVDMQKKWQVRILSKKGDKVTGGSIIAEVQETSLIKNKIMIPPYVEGVIEEIKEDGLYSCGDTILKVREVSGKITNVGLCQKWPIRVPRPFKSRKPISGPLITGQRVIDVLFPIAKGGTAAIPGGFGTGKTMMQHQMAKWSDAQIIIYIGCGERGNEMTQVLEEFSKLKDPKSNQPLLNRTLLIANTSNMPVAAREASIYTGITIAEYYRDMGYDVAIMADSTSRWAEALREISGRLEEMPAEEGFPAYLPSRLAEFYERAGNRENLNKTTGSVSVIGAVSPQGGDFSEPVTQNTKRFIRCFWALDKSLAYSRHYPAINWLHSYSEYATLLSDWYKGNVDELFCEKRAELIKILQEESSLMDIVKLIGADVLPEEQKLILEIARVIRSGFLEQNAHHQIDTFVPIKKQFLMMDTILYLYKRCKRLIQEEEWVVSTIKESGIFDKVIKAKYQCKNDNFKLLDEIKEEINKILL